MTEAQEEHLIEGFCLESVSPFESGKERKKIYFENRDDLFVRARDPRRVETHFFYSDRSEPAAYHFNGKSIREWLMKKEMERKRRTFEI